MSLINEALKKAQRQRSEGADAPASPEAGTTTPRIARRDKPAGFRSQMFAAAGIGAVVVLLVVGGGIYWFTRPSPKSSPAPTPTVATQPAKVESTAAAPAASPTANPGVASADIKSAPPTPAPGRIAPAAAAVTLANTPPASTPAAAAPVETPKSTPPPAAAVATAPPTGPFTLPLSAPAPTVTSSAASLAPTSVAKTAEKPKASLHMITIIENLHVAGIRAAGEDSKVLMNDRVYRLNDIVDHELGIKLTAVTTKALTFEDDQGAVYTRNF